jgi:hypothetical protein
MCDVSDCVRQLCPPDNGLDKSKLHGTLTWGDRNRLRIVYQHDETTRVHCDINFTERDDWGKHIVPGLATIHRALAERE